MPDRTVAPEIRPFGKLTIPAETIETLDNGLTLHHLRGGDQPVCTLTIAFEGGASEKGEALGRLLLNMLCEQTARHSADEVSEIIDYNGARLSGQLMSHHSALKLFALTHRTADMLPGPGDAERAGIRFCTLGSDKDQVHTKFANHAYGYSCACRRSYGTANLGR